MNKKTLSALIIILSVVISGIIVGSAAMAQTQSITQVQNREEPSNIQFPIAELGNCQNNEDCKAFCDDTKNIEACLIFAEKHNLMTSEELAAAKKFKDVGMTGPGGCKGKDACDEYCSNKDNIEACIAFAEKNGLMSEQKLQESKKVLTAIKKSAKPLGCNNQQECDGYCATAEHMEECINFGIEAGILAADQQSNARKVLTAIKNGAVPPCQGKACPAFCRNRANVTACEKFRKEAGIPTRSEMVVIQRILTLITEKGITMPTCSGEQGCQDYCSQNTHIEECVKFAEDKGVITSSQAKAARAGEEAAPEGPGGCKTKEECDTFCDNPDNSETCFNFAKENGLISAEEQKKIEGSQKQIKESFNNMPAEVLTCLTSSLGVDTIEKLKSGNAMPGKKMAEQMKTCFESFTPTPPSPPSGPETGKDKDRQGQGGGKDKGEQGGQPQQPSKPTPPTQPTPPVQPTKPEKPSDAVNPTKCAEDCQYVGDTCLSQQREADKVCLENGRYCREVTCNSVLYAEGNRPTQEESDRCFSRCAAVEDPCHAVVVAKSSACTTTKDVCVMNCQKAAKSGKPQQPQQPGQQPSKPNKPPKPTQPGSTKGVEPTEPSEPAPPQPPTQPNQPAPPTRPTPPTQPPQPAPPQ